MNSLFKINIKNIVLFIMVGLSTISVSAQERKLKTPKKVNAKSVDDFVMFSFELYGKMYTLDSINVTGGQLPEEIEDAILESLEYNVDSLIETIPDIIDDIDDLNWIKKAKATLNLNKARKALTYTAKSIKIYLLGSKEEEEERN